MCSPINCVQLLVRHFILVFVNMFLLEPQGINNRQVEDRKPARGIRFVFSSTCSLDWLHSSMFSQGVTHPTLSISIRWQWATMLPATKELHAEERENKDEEEEQEDEGDDGLHGVHQRYHQVSQRRPIPWRSQNITLLQKQFFKCEKCILYLFLIENLQWNFSCQSLITGLTYLFLFLFAFFIVYSVTAFSLLH